MWRVVPKWNKLIPAGTELAEATSALPGYARAHLRWANFVGLRWAHA